MAAQRNTSFCNTVNVSTVEGLISTNCFDQEEQVPCPYGYVYDDDKSDAFYSLSAENDWVCEKEEYGSNLLMAQSVGFIFNSLIFMHLSDT